MVVEWNDAIQVRDQDSFRTHIPQTSCGFLDKIDSVGLVLSQTVTADKDMMPGMDKFTDGIGITFGMITKIEYMTPSGLRECRQ